MNFFEQFFHVAPDGGSGVLEAVYVVIGAAAIATVAFRRRLARWIGTRSPARREPVER